MCIRDRHYRVRLRESTLVDAQKRYAEARVEIQVASVLMHAWAEVEHDLVYKPYQGALSEDEFAILDELNGTVIAGEIALERLQKAGDVRVAARGHIFANHYELAAHLLSVLGPLGEPDALQAGLGRVDLLQDFLERLRLATPEGTARYLTALHADLERRPIADQIVDQLLVEDATRYPVYEAIRASRPSTDVAPEAAEPVGQDEHEAMGLFISKWIELESIMRGISSGRQRHVGPGSAINIPQLLAEVIKLDRDTLAQFERLRRCLLYTSRCV